MPYHNLGSCKTRSQSVSCAQTKVDERDAGREKERRGTNLRVAQMIQSLLVRSIGFLQVIHHQMAMTCRKGARC